MAKITDNPYRAIQVYGDDQFRADLDWLRAQEPDVPNRSEMVRRLASEERKRREKEKRK